MSNNTFITEQLSLDYTYHFSKYSCVKSFYFLHVIACWVIFLAGIGCMMSRVIPLFKWAHAWCGRIFVLSMLWSTGFSMLIHNTGLPLGVLISFVWCIGGLTAGWVVIKVHEERMQRKALKNLEANIASGLASATNLEKAINVEKGKIASRKSCKERMLSLKALHGSLMFMSWYNIAGRIFASNQSGDFNCYTYPVYKPINTLEYATRGMNLAGEDLQMVPLEDPRYDRLPWANFEAGWGAITGPGMMLFALGVGAIVAWREAKAASTTVEAMKLKELQVDPTSSKSHGLELEPAKSQK